MLFRTIVGLTRISHNHRYVSRSFRNSSLRLSNKRYIPSEADINKASRNQIWDFSSRVGYGIENWDSFKVFSEQYFGQSTDSIQEEPTIMNKFKAFIMFTSVNHPFIRESCPGFDLFEFCRGAKTAFMKFQHALGTRDFFSFVHGTRQTSEFNDFLKETCTPRVYQACFDGIKAMSEPARNSIANRKLIRWVPVDIDPYIHAADFIVLSSLGSSESQSGVTIGGVPELLYERYLDNHHVEFVDNSMPIVDGIPAGAMVMTIRLYGSLVGETGDRVSGCSFAMRTCIDETMPYEWKIVDIR